MLVPALHIHATSPMVYKSLLWNGLCPETIFIGSWSDAAHLCFDVSDKLTVY